MYGALLSYSKCPSVKVHSGDRLRMYGALLSYSKCPSVKVHSGDRLRMYGALLSYSKCPSVKAHSGDRLRMYGALLSYSKFRSQTVRMHAVCSLTVRMYLLSYCASVWPSLLSYSKSPSQLKCTPGLK